VLVISNCEEKNRRGEPLISSFTSMRTTVQEFSDPKARKSDCFGALIGLKNSLLLTGLVCLFVTIAELAIHFITRHVF